MPLPSPERVMLDVVSDPPGATVVLGGSARRRFTPRFAATSTAWLEVRRFDRVLPPRR